MRSTVGRQLNSKAERWYHGEGRRQERKHGATASPEFLTGDLTGAGDPPHGTPLLSSAVRPGRFPHCPARLATPPGDPRRTSGESSTNRAAVGDFAWSPNSVGPSPMRSRDLEIGRPGKIGSLTHPPGRTPRRSTNVRRRCAPVQCPDLLAAAPRNRRLELERADRCLSRKGDGSRVRIGLAGGNSSRRPA
jgi:hypothetical protein